MKKQLSMKGLADYMVAGAAKQRAILHAYKYPTDDKARAKVLYYREARDRVAAFHKARHPTKWLQEHALHLDALARSSRGQTRTRLQNNARGLDSYASNFDGNYYDVLKDVTLALDFGDVRVTATPDLHVTDRGKLKLIKLGFASSEPDTKVVTIVCQLLFEAAAASLKDVSSSSVAFLDVPRWRVHKGARRAARLGRDIEATCATISDIWNAI